MHHVMGLFIPFMWGELSSLECLHVLTLESHTSVRCEAHDTGM